MVEEEVYIRVIRMKKECFTCKNRICRKLTEEERKAWRKKTGRWIAPNLEVTCTIHNKIITLNDPACEQYKSDKEMEEIREDMRKFAHNELRKMGRI